MFLLEEILNSGRVRRRVLFPDQAQNQNTAIWQILMWAYTDTRYPDEDGFCVQNLNEPILS